MAEPNQVSSFFAGGLSIAATPREQGQLGGSLIAGTNPGHSATGARWCMHPRQQVQESGGQEKRVVEPEERLRCNALKWQ